jgi:hypothetical protein
MIRNWLALPSKDDLSFLAAVQGEAEGRQVWLHILCANDEQRQGPRPAPLRLEEAAGPRRIRGAPSNVSAAATLA